jgi:hypothetical protein
MGETIWLDVPYRDNAAVKAAGGRWDRDHRRWFAPRPDMTDLQSWVALPTVLPGEDRTYGAGLYVDPIPESCWFTNVRSCVDKADWDRLRRMVYARAENECEECGSQKDPQQQVWLEAHERWSYDTVTRTQTLRRLVCLCSRCHLATHYGFAQVTGRVDEALFQLMDVNDWTLQAASAHVDDAARLWAERSRYDWDLDLTMLTAAGVRLAEPPARFRRRGIADQTARAARVADTSRSTAAPAPTTSAPAALQVPLGWNPDPLARFHQRWWNGYRWTADVLTDTGRRATDQP